MAGTAPKTWRIAVLTSGHGRGSNLRAMHAWFRDNGASVEIAFATAAKEDAPVTALCRELGIPCEVIDPRSRAGFETRVCALCAERGIDLIALAGFMSLLSADFLNRVGIPILNIHPALLPDFGGKGMYGIKVHEAVFAGGAKVSGASVHLVDPHYDHGEIIARQIVPITDCSTAEEIAERVLRTEHQLYAPAIATYLETHCP